MASSSLEQQALDRVARMYSSYDNRVNRRPTSPESVRMDHHAVNDGGRGENGSSEPIAAEESAERKSKPAPQLKADDEAVPKASGFLASLMEDKEQSLIMLLLVILMKDGADLNMILALMYLLV